MVLKSFNWKPDNGYRHKSVKNNAFNARHSFTGQVLICVHAIRRQIFTMYHLWFKKQHWYDVFSPFREYESIILRISLQVYSIVRNSIKNASTVTLWNGMSRTFLMIKVQICMYLTRKSNSRVIKIKVCFFKGWFVLLELSVLISFW
jgi:hypothetical protein